jgi:SpoVK/Ycf46/Vps4 family AAA+-type ATPase
MTAPRSAASTIPAYATAAEHLADHLARARAILGDRGDDATEAILASDAAMAARERATGGTPLCALLERAGLDDDARHVLVLAALPSLDGVLGARLQSRIRGSVPTVRELVDLLALRPAHDAPLLAAFAPDAPLRAHGLIEVVGGDRTPLASCAVHVDDRVAGFLRGDDRLDSALAELARLHTVAPVAADPVAAASLRRLVASSAPLLIEGPERVGKTTAAIAAIVALGRRALVADLEVVLCERPVPEILARLARLHREALLLDAVLVLRAGDTAERWPAAVARHLARQVQIGNAILAIRSGDAICRALCGPRRIAVAMPGALEQERIWRGALPAGVSASAACARYPLPPGDIVLAAAAATARGEVEHRRVTDRDVVVAARERLCHRLGDVAELVTTTLDWNDLVVRDDVATRIHEILAAVRFRDRVMQDWGFAQKLPYGRSISALFSGAPGTGKTMVATLIGNELGLEVFRVDLSRVVSKYIGETEKNLARVCDEASRCRAAILFDEADSLFAKRTEVATSNDRYANLEVNFLLQRLEQHDGVVLLTSNAATSIDPAFLRRLRYRVDFPEPDEVERAQLWAAMMPRTAPLAGDVDLVELGRRFKLTGGHIKNAVVRAAFLAASEGLGAISQDALVRAAQLEWTELGHVGRG